MGQFGYGSNFMDEFIFEIKDIYFSYLNKIPALNGLSLKVKKGERVVFLGANGSGKSTLLKIMDGLIFSQKGSISVFGNRLDESILNGNEFSRDFRRKVGFLFQNSEVQLFCPTVEEEIYFGPLQLGLDIKEIKEKADNLIEILGLQGLEGRSPQQLSIGEKRKVAIASILILEPEVLLLDEPTAGLDPKSACQLIDIINEENEKGRTVISATHDLHLVYDIADIVYLLSEDKKIAHAGRPEEILANETILTEHNLIHMHVHQHKDGSVHKHRHGHGEHFH